MLNVAGLLSATFLEHVEDSFQKGILMLSLLIFILLTIAGYQSFRFSRRIAGPVYAFIKHIKKCREIDRLEPIQLRENDLFQELADEFNKLAESQNRKS